MNTKVPQNASASSQAYLMFLISHPSPLQIQPITQTVRSIMIDEAQFQERVMDIYTDQLDEASRPVRDNLHVSFEEEATIILEKKRIG